LGQERVDAGALRRKAPLFLPEPKMGALSSRENPKPKEQKRLQRSAIRGNRKQRIAELLVKIESQLDVGKMKITLADFIRLTQLERELEQDDRPREIIVTWKDPSEKNVG
jgi:hypothetical protein